MSLKQPLHSTNVLQPKGVHASNDLESLPQLHFSIGWFRLHKNICCIAEPKDKFESVKFQVSFLLIEYKDKIDLEKTQLHMR